MIVENGLVGYGLLGEEFLDLMGCDLVFFYPFGLRFADYLSQ